MLAYFYILILLEGYARLIRTRYPSPKQLPIDTNMRPMSLCFTVMRLTKPTLFTNLPVTCEDRDLPGKHIH